MLIALLGAQAFGYDTIGHLWDETVVWDATDVAVPGVADPVAEARAAADTWQQAGCVSALDLQFGAVVPDDGLSSPLDGVNRVQFHDPGDDIPEAGVLAVSFVRSTGFVEGTPYLDASEFDVVVNDDVAFTDDVAGGCSDTYDLASVLTHEFGHVVGVDHSEVEGALMQIGPPACTELRGLTDDDRLAAASLYGDVVQPRCWTGDLGATVGPNPLPITCDAVPLGAGDPGWTGAWDVDGQTFDGPTLDTTVEGEGVHTVVGCVTPEQAGCTERCTTFELVACDPPGAALSLEGEGRIWTLRNETPIPFAGCLTSVLWEVLDDQDRRVESSDDWEPEIVVPQEGLYRVLLTVGGPGGEATASAELDTGRGARTCGCHTTVTWPSLLDLIARR